MTTRPGRNDPCHCGSGKKYKHCHLRADETAPELAPPAAATSGSAGAVELAIDWLTARHRKGFKAAVEALFDDWWPDDAPGRHDDIDADTLQAIQINLVEWLLAEGEMQVKGASHAIHSVLLGADGPHLADGQRRWLTQLAERALRLYTVTEVRPGVGLTLCDALLAEVAPLQVQERMASRQARPGMLIGARVMQVGDHFELSGAIYPFTMLAQSAVLADVLTAMRAADESGLHADNLPPLRSRAIARAWLRQFVMPPEMPKMVDASTGESILLVTDHYRVLDAAALASALAACADVKGEPRAGWRRELEGGDGVLRSLAAINPGRQPDRIEIFYRTQRHADEGRAWFDRIAGAAVRHLTREISDPQGLMRSAAPKPNQATASPSLAPEALANAIEQALRRSYARWADEPMPLLDGKTPRQAITSAAGLERVKGLLRSYERGEADMAARDGRRVVSHQFLWDVLGITR